MSISCCSGRCPQRRESRFAADDGGRYSEDHIETDSGFHRESVDAVVDDAPADGLFHKDNALRRG
jgi:hypothetical protein